MTNPPSGSMNEHVASSASSGSTLFGFFKVRQTHDRTMWNAWGALERMSSNDPITEPAEPVHFCFSETEDDAVEKLTAEMDAAYGKRRWWRQACNPI